MASVGLSGLYTGLNTDQWVTNLMAADNQRVYTQVIKQRAVQAKQSAWQRIQSTLTTLQTQSDTLGKVDTFRLRTATSSETAVADVGATGGAALGSHTIAVTSLAQAHLLSASSTATTATSQLNLSGQMTINGKPLDLVSSDSLNAVRDKINALGANVTATVVPIISGTTTTYTLQLASTKLGTANAITMSGALAQDAALNFQTSTGAWTKQIAAATDAVFTLDDSNYSMTTNNITTVLPNVSITLKKAGSTTISVAQDADGIVSAIQAWANAHNGAVAQFDAETKVSLKDGKLDSTQAKSPLVSDPVALNIKQTLRGFLSRTVNGLPSDHNQLSQIGITTGAWGTVDYGRVVVDATKLKAEVQKDPDAVARIFGAITDVNTTGIAKDLSSLLKTELTPVTGPMASQDGTFNTQIKDISDQIARMNDRITQRQKALRSQFARMEAAIASLKSQGAAFASQISMMMPVGGN